jgi:hypothetical protein
LRKFVKFVKKIQSDCCKQKCDLWKCIWLVSEEKEIYPPTAYFRIKDKAL